MKKLFYVIITVLFFIPFIVTNAAIKTVTTCDNPTRDENNRQVKVCYLDIDVSGSSKFQTVKGKFTLTNTTFKVAPTAGDSRVKMTDNGNNTYTFSVTKPLSNQKVRLAKFTMYLSENGRECKIVWSPIEYVNSYCEYKDGNYYDLNGNIVSEKEYRKQCEKHTCEIIDGTYYGKDGKEVSKTEYQKTCEKHTCEVVGGTYFGKDGKAVNATEYDKQCNKHYCEVVGDTYFGKDGKSVTATEYKKQCEKHYCEVINGSYYDKNGNQVKKAEYLKSCTNPTCKVIDGTYYDKNSKVVSATEYDKQCNVHYCKIIDDTYFGRGGNIVDKSVWETECSTEAPQTGGFFSITTALMGTFTLAGMMLVSRKINKVKKI